ncbi:ShKT domain-containing protein [Aphelenchoides besseyi]|nr:ShKT domain-containing protein [Aphelenchoides besseyi]
MKLVLLFLSFSVVSTATTTKLPLPRTTTTTVKPTTVSASEVLIFEIISAQLISEFKAEQSNRLVPKSQSTGPCKPNGKCANSRQFCDQSTGNCFQKKRRPKKKRGKKKLRTTTKRPQSPIRRCFDRSVPGGSSDCPSKAYLCQNSVYYQLMSDQCPRTCNRCRRG